MRGAGGEGGRGWRRSKESRGLKSHSQTHNSQEKWVFSAANRDNYCNYYRKITNKTKTNTFSYFGIFACANMSDFHPPLKLQRVYSAPVTLSLIHQTASWTHLDLLEPLDTDLRRAAELRERPTRPAAQVLGKNSHKNSPQTRRIRKIRRTRRNPRNRRNRSGSPAAETILRLEVRLTLELLHRHVGSTSTESVLQTLPPPAHSNARARAHVHPRGPDRAAGTMRLLWVPGGTGQASGGGGGRGGLVQEEASGFQFWSSFRG